MVLNPHCILLPALTRIHEAAFVLVTRVPRTEELHLLRSLGLLPLTFHDWPALRLQLVQMLTSVCVALEGTQDVAGRQHFGMACGFGALTYDVDGIWVDFWCWWNTGFVAWFGSEHDYAVWVHGAFGEEDGADVDWWHGGRFVVVGSFDCKTEWRACGGWVQ